MSYNTFPTLPGLAFNVVKTPVFKTLVQEAASGRCSECGLMQYPLWEWTLTYDLLRETLGYAELQTLIGFFNQRYGRLTPFIFSDAHDNAVAALFQIGTGDGSTMTFRITRPYGGFVEPVFNPTNCAFFYGPAGGSQYLPGHCSVSQDGLLTFTGMAAPTTGTKIWWTGSFSWLVNFMADTSEYSEFMYALFELKKIQFRSRKFW